MQQDTREQLLESATRLFAARGFYGASLANIADELGLTKQALLHHFGRKEKLYAEILSRIGERSQRPVLTLARDTFALVEHVFVDALVQQSVHLEFHPGLG